MRSSSKRYLFLAALSFIAVSLACSGSGGGGGGGGGMLTTPPGQWVGAATTGVGGTQTWNLTIDRVTRTFSFTKVTGNKHYSGTLAFPASLFLENVTTSTDDATLPPVPTTGHSIEVPSNLVALDLFDASTSAALLVNTNGTCPNLAGPTTFNKVRYGWTAGFDSSVDPAYATVLVTQNNSNFTRTETPFKLNGTPLAALPSENLSCANGYMTGMNGDAGFSPTTLVGFVGPAGTTTHSSLLFPVPANPVNIIALTAARYTAVIFKDSPVVSLQLAGFGPGAVPSMTGGTFTNISTDLFNTHANNITITFSNTGIPSIDQPSNGLLTGTVTDGNGAHTPMIAEVTQVGGFFQIFILTTDASSTQPYHIFLSQQ